MTVSMYTDNTLIIEEKSKHIEMTGQVEDFLWKINSIDLLPSCPPIYIYSINGHVKISAEMLSHP